MLLLDRVHIEQGKFKIETRVIDIYVSISVIFRSKIYVKMDSINISVNISE